MNKILRTLCALPMLAAVLTSAVFAQPPVASTGVTTGARPGVTLYQASGLKGSIPLKKIYKVDPSGDTGQYTLEFASANMNTVMQIMAKFVVPSGMTFQSFEVRTANGNQQVTPAGADSWDGQTIIDKVTVSPWNMNRVLQQCIAQLDNGDGTFKSSATFDLEADATEVIRGKGIAKFPNAPPGSAASAEGTVRPKTRVTATIVSEERRDAKGRGVSRVSTPRDDRPRGEQPRVVLPSRALQRQPVAPGRLIGSTRPVPAKDRFERTKPHVNAASPPARHGLKSRVPQR